MKFAPLHIITGYSFLQSGLTMSKITRSLKKNDYFGMGISDNEVMYGVPPFVKAMNACNKPYLVGEQFTIEGDTLCLYVISEEGYHNLMHINVEVMNNDLTFSFLKEHSQGLVAILETIRGTFREKFVENYDISFNKYLLQFASIYKEDFYLGLEVTSREDNQYTNRIRKFANEFTYKCIAFPRIRYEKKDDAIVIKMVEAIAEDNKIEEKECIGQEYFMTEDNYSKIYTPSELSNTIEIIKQSTFVFEKKRGELLHYPVADAKAELSRICNENIAKLGLNDEKHIKRLEHELDVISTMGYADYFLIVQDYVHYAKTHDILVGPGRGSAAGSLVSYLLGITEVDPLEYNLQFERFLNPYRKTMPDIDVDFMDIRRDDMVQYLRDRYGSNRVANIVTFQTIGAKQALRDIGRIYNISTNHIDMLSKKLSKRDLDLRASYKEIPEFRSLIDKDSYLLEIVSLASKIEGLPRQSGLHAAGVIMDDKPLIESIPVTILGNDNCITQYEAEYLEEQGLLKMDFLSLSNLTIIYNCVKLINSRHPGLNLKADEIPYKDDEIFKLISDNKTLGLFQIETDMMRRSIKTLKPKNFNDVVAVLMLGRPGPMKHIPTYANRRDGLAKFSYGSKDLEEVLKETYGIIVYQEQINSVAMKMAGFSLAEADMFRRAVSKKEKETLLKLKTQFVQGSIKNGYKEEFANKVFNDILEFAGYGFNKAHSVVYAIITCRMAWLKVHYPLEFFASLLGHSDANSDSRFSEYVSEMKYLGIEMYSPSVNYSSFDFVIKDNGLLFPLTGIKDVNISLTENIEKERKDNGLFTDFFNFVLRMYKYKISERSLQSLISAGAFDELYPSRASLRLMVLATLQYAEMNYRDDGQLSIGIPFAEAPKMKVAKDNPLDNLNKEYEVLGTMISANPISYKRERLNTMNVMPISEAKELKEASVAGIVKSKKTITTKKGEQMAFVKIFDESGDLEITVFSDTYSESSSLLEKNSIVIIKFNHQIRGDDESYVAQQISKLEEE